MSDFQTGEVVWKLFFGVIKAVVVCFTLTAGALVASQSSVAPVSVRLLSAYAMEYAVATFKPVRNLFPEPYLIQFNTK